MDELWAWLLILSLAIVGAAVLVSQGPLPQPAFISPAPGSEVGLPARVVLQGLPDGAQVGVRLLDSYGRVLSEDAAQAKRGRAEIALYYDLPASDQGRLEAFLPVPGLDHVVLASIPVRFTKVPYIWLQGYFLDEKGTPFPLIRRVLKTSAVATSALGQLLSGPTWRERTRGYWTALPPGTELLDLSIAAGAAEVRLDGEIRELAPELRALALRQIERTLLEFPTVSEVRVYAGGEYLGP